MELIPIIDASEFPNIIHGTYLKNLGSIKREGLKRMTRNHIHFTYDLSDKKVRKSANVFIYINLDKALKDGLKFFKAKNEVILSPGNEFGIIEPKYFLKIETKCR